MKKQISSAVLLLITIFLVSCKTPEEKKITVTPAAEKSKNISGKAVITEIKTPSDSSVSDIRGYMSIYYNFIPSDPAAAEKYNCADCSANNIKLIYDNRDIFHTNWIKKWEIKQGNVYPVIRHYTVKSDNSIRVSDEIFLEPVK